MKMHSLLKHPSKSYFPPLVLREVCDRKGGENHTIGTAETFRERQRTGSCCALTIARQRPRLPLCQRILEKHSPADCTAHQQMELCRAGGF